MTCRLGSGPDDGGFSTTLTFLGGSAVAHRHASAAMSSAEGSVIACNLPEPILDYIFDLAEASIAEARAFSLVCRAWLVPARTVLFREVTVLVERGYRITASVGKTHPDGREITLYPRCMALQTFTQLATCNSYLLSFVQVLKTSNDDLVQFLSSNVRNGCGSLRRIRELWLSDMTVSADVDFHRLFEHFPVLRALRIQNLRGARPSKDTDILGVERAGPVFVRLVGCVSLALRDSLAGSKHSRIVEFSTFHVDPVQTYADGVAGVFRRHAETLTSVNFYMPYFAMGASTLPSPSNYAAYATRKRTHLHIHRSCPRRMPISSHSPLRIRAIHRGIPDHRTPDCSTPGEFEVSTRHI